MPSGRRRARMPAALLVVFVAALAGCGGADVSEDGDETGFKSSWDLTEPPTREQVGMADDRSTVIYEVHEPREVTLDLPEDVSLRLPLTLVTFDSLGAVPPTDSDPVGLDAKTDRMPLEETVEVYRSALEQLGMKTGRARAFGDAASGQPDGGGRVSSQVSDGRYGYLRLQVLAQYEPDVGRGYVKISGAWGEGLPKQ